MKRLGFAKIFLFMAILFSTINVGNGSWLITKQEANFSRPVTANSSVAACYIEKTVGEAKVRTKYTSIEKALKVSETASEEQTIVVLPGTNPEIKNDCTIAANVSLILPYDFNKSDWSYSDYTNYKNQSNNGFADKDADSVKANRKNVLTIDAGVTLINNGTIDIAGKIGVGAESNQRPSGFTLGSYCEILMKTNSKIENYGSINLYGYIKEAAKNNGSIVENKSLGKIKTPFTIYDFKGGSYSKAANDKNIMPFSYFDFPNCHVKQVFEYGSKLFGSAVLYASNDYYSAESLVLGTIDDDCLFRLSNGSAVIKYRPAKFGFTTSDVSNDVTDSSANYTDVTIEGDLNISSFKISVSIADFDSSQVDCPICYKYQIIQNSGTLTISDKIKFLSGSSLTIGKSAKGFFNAPISFYQGYSPLINIGSVCPQKMGRATLLVNGELTIDSKFGGLINTENSNGTAITGSNFTNYYETLELISCSGSWFSTGPKDWDKHVEYAECYSLSGNFWSALRLEKEKEYKLEGNYWERSNTKTDISFLTLDKTYGKSDNNKTAAYTINAKCDYVPATSTDIKYTWQIEPKLNLNIEENKVTFTTDAATSKEIIYTLTCTVSFKRATNIQDTVKLTGEFVAAYSSSSGGGGCLLPTAKVLMADGTYKQAGSIKTGDAVISFNHETGKFEPNRVIGNDHAGSEDEMRSVVHLEFLNGKATDFIYSHAYFDKTLNRYVNLYEDNYDEYIGHEFVYYDDGNANVTTLVSASIERMNTALAAPATANHLNLVADDMLSVEAGLDGLYNIFEYDPGTLSFDKEKKEADMAEYGLLGYESFEKYFPKEIYDLLPCKYLGVSIGKGLISWDIFEGYVNRWKDLLMENL